MWQQRTLSATTDRLLRVICGATRSIFKIEQDFDTNTVPINLKEFSEEMWLLQFRPPGQLDQKLNKLYTLTLGSKPQKDNQSVSPDLMLYCAKYHVSVTNSFLLGEKLSQLLQVITGPFLWDIWSIFILKQDFLPNNVLIIFEKNQ